MAFRGHKMRCYLLWYNTETQGSIQDITEFRDELIILVHQPQKSVEEFLRQEMQADEILHALDDDDVMRQFKNLREFICYLN